jgi:hypothetical protein
MSKRLVTTMRVIWLQLAEQHGKAVNSGDHATHVTGTAVIVVYPVSGADECGWSSA